RLQEPREPLRPQGDRPLPVKTHGEVLVPARARHIARDHIRDLPYGEEGLVGEEHPRPPVDGPRRPEQPDQNRPMLAPEQVVRLVLGGRGTDALTGLGDARRGGLGVDQHRGVGEDGGVAADQLLPLRAGLVAGDLKRPQLSNLRPPTPYSQTFSGRSWPNVGSYARLSSSASRTLPPLPTATSLPSPSRATAE